MLRINGATDRGMLREANEDRFAGEVFDRTTGYAVVCDGMGGMAGGSMASGLACEEVRRMVESSLRPNMDERSASLLLQSAVANANWAVYDRAMQAGPEYRGMGTTLCAVLLCGDTATIVNVGDSRCYLLRAGELTCQTRDHTMVTALLERGEITPEEAAHHPDRHLITRAIGVEAEVDPDYYILDLQKGDSLLLCTDGLYNMLTPQQLLAALQQSIHTDNAHYLIDQANAAGGHDNITAVIIHIR